MSLPSSGQISMSQVNTELSLSSTAQISFNDAAVRALFVKASGAISMSDGWGKSNTVVVTFYYTGSTQSYSVPSGMGHVTVNAYGGGGGAGIGVYGGNGGVSNVTWTCSGAEDIYMDVGRGGSYSYTAWPNGGTPHGIGGGGGGTTEVWFDGTRRCIAGAGGGSANGGNTNGYGGDAGYNGTDGGGASGAEGGGGGQNNGGGGAGGASDGNGGATSGSAGSGMAGGSAGTGDYDPGSGGGGYGGGGGGGGHDPYSPYGAGGGGGGSCHIFSGTSTSQGAYGGAGGPNFGSGADGEVTLTFSA